jgi:TetR/AcrR family transcriptional regulator
MDISSDTENKIIHAASEIFLEKGKDGARMQEIADKAGINKALLHYYFRSKEKLFRTVFKRELKGMLDNIFGSLSPTDSFREFLQTFIRKYFQNINKRKNISRFIIWELENSADEIVECFLEVFNERGISGNPLILRVQQAIEDKEIRLVDPENFVISLIGMCIFPFIAAPLLEHILPGFDLNNPEFLTNREKAILDILWDGIKK